MVTQETLIGVAKDATRPPAERLAALDELETVKGGSTWKKLGVDHAKLKAELTAAIAAEPHIVEEDGVFRLMIGGELYTVCDSYAEAEDELSTYLSESGPQAATGPADPSPLDASTDGADDGAQATADGADAVEPASVEVTVNAAGRGGITSLVGTLLRSTMSYSDIVQHVKERYPDAGTTERSIASVAVALRKKGVIIPERRRVGGSPKASKTERIVLSEHELETVRAMRRLNGEQLAEIGQVLAEMLEELDGDGADEQPEAAQIVGEVAAQAADEGPDLLDVADAEVDKALEPA